jgi:hypothetical protein
MLSSVINPFSAPITDRMKLEIALCPFTSTAISVKWNDPPANSEPLLRIPALKLAPDAPTGFGKHDHVTGAVPPEVVNVNEYGAPTNPMGGLPTISKIPPIRTRITWRVM